MKVLLDTCAFLWMLLDAPDLSAEARLVLENRNNDLFLSAASCWEIAIKHRMGKIQIKGDIERHIPEQMQKLSISALAVLPSHALRTAVLAAHHRDPFDRLLVAQSELERLPILSPDPLFKPYGVKLIW